MVAGTAVRADRGAACAVHDVAVEVDGVVEVHARAVLADPEAQELERRHHVLVVRVDLGTHAFDAESSGERRARGELGELLRGMTGDGVMDFLETVKVVA